MIEHLVSLFAPHSCLICKKEGKLLCVKCAPLVIETKTATCFLCNKLSKGFRTCKSCRAHSKISGVIVASHYTNNAKVLIRLLKYKQAREAAWHIANLLSIKIDPTDFDLITSVPATAIRYRQRGFNQAALIATNLAKDKGIIYKELLGRVGKKRQVGTARAQRFAQIKNTIYVKNSLEIKNKRILLIDDVVTTGATINECGRVLKEAGAKTIWGAAFAKH